MVGSHTKAERPGLLLLKDQEFALVGCEELQVSLGTRGGGGTTLWPQHLGETQQVQPSGVNTLLEGVNFVN